MYSAKITFDLVVPNLQNKRFLQTSVKGTGIQDCIAQGSFSKNSYLIDFLAAFNCESSEGIDSTNLQIKNLKIIYSN